MKTIKTQAIVLKRTNFGEADRVIQFLTPNGKLSAIAKGVRREKSKMAGGIELFAVCDLVVAEGKSDLGIVTSARISRFYKNILVNYDRMQFAYQVIKLISSASEQLDGSDWYEILNEVFAGIDSHSINFELVQTWFYLRYSVLTGYELSLRRDIDGNDLLSGMNYSYDLGERGLRQNTKGEIGTEHIKLMRLINTKSLKVLAQIGGINDVISDCLMVAHQHAAV